MRPFHVSRAICFFFGVFAAFSAPVLADERDSELPIVLAAMVASVAGWLLFDREIRKERREESGE